MAQQRVLITGGAGGLATALAAAFQRHGDHVTSPGRGELDVTCGHSVRRFFENAAPFDLVIANAGLNEDRLLARLSEESWDRQLGVNLHGAVRCAEAVWPTMTAAGAGHLIFISSHSALHPPPGQTAYATAKAALLGLTAALAREAGAANVRVNAILPGFLETPMTSAVSDERRAAVLCEHALGRLNTPEAVAGFVVHLHHHLPHTSGQTFQLDSRPG